ncbi:hypothetical protein F5890DRAFT_1479137 [Lentinula detonsa]|uniref:Uncharacterized protein n=1 Tax=Lentinula detonsa TaxID=2804962 RepID=A0AA38PP23_9AGAR|nr:hypothetical protein F5890DRAFT_1479137 [Lentinula detonsa]
MDMVITEDRLWMTENCAIISAIIQISLSLPGNETNEQLVIDILQQNISQGISSAGTQFQSFSACLLTSNSNLGIQCGLDSLYMEFLFNSAIVNFIIPFLALGYDIYIFGLTMRKTIDLGFKMKRQGQSSVAHVIIQDGKFILALKKEDKLTLAQGILYFLITHDPHLRVVLVSAVIEAILTGITLKDQIENVVLISSISAPFFGFLPNLLISRLMLNLRTFPTPGTGDTLTQRANLSSLHFASNQMLGNIGAPLDGGSFSEEEEELNEVEIELENIS